MAVLHPLERAFFESSTAGEDMCAKCTMPILQGQIEWNWQFGGPVGMLRMHTDCTLEWVRQLMDDMEELEELETEINDD